MLRRAPWVLVCWILRLCSVPSRHTFPGAALPRLPSFSCSLRVPTLHTAPALCLTEAMLLSAVLLAFAFGFWVRSALLTVRTALVTRVRTVVQKLPVKLLFWAQANFSTSPRTCAVPRRTTHSSLMLHCTFFCTVQHRKVPKGRRVFLRAHGRLI